MSFHPPEPLPESKRPDAIELGPTGGIKEETKSEYRDRAPKSGTEFDAETAELFRTLDSLHDLEDVEREELLNEFFHPYNTREKSFSKILGDPKTAPRALELLRQIYARYPYSDTDRKKRSAYKNTYDFSPEDITRWVVSALDDLDRELARTDLDEKSLRRLQKNVFYVVSEAQNTGDSQARYAIDKWIARHHDELEALDPFFWEPSDDSQDQMSLYARRNFYLHAGDGIAANQHLEALVRLRDRAHEIGIGREIDEKIFWPILAEEREDDPSFDWQRERLARALAAQYGLDPSIVDTWKEAKVGLGPDTFMESYWSNLEAISELETKKLGAAKKLYEDYGIANFGRYEQDMLLRQIDIADKDPRYGIVIYPEADYNGAFFQNGKQLYDASLQLRTGGFETRIVEAGSQRELARRLLRLHKKYSPAGNKFSFAIVGGHGSPNSIALGNDKPLDPPPFPDPKKSQEEYEKELDVWRKSISTDTGRFVTDDLLEGEGIQRALQEWFEESAPKVLVSCSTGAEGGIAEQASAQSSGEVTAPKIPTNVKKIDVSFDTNGKPVFSVEYFAGTAARYAAGEAK